MGRDLRYLVRVPPRLTLSIRSPAIFALNLIGIRPLARASYKAIAKVVSIELGRTEGVHSCMLRGGAVDGCVPGLSDLDFAVLVESPDTDTLASTLLRLRRVWANLKTRYLIPGELVVLDAPRLDWMLRHRPPLIESFRAIRVLSGNGFSVKTPRPNPFASLCLAFEYTGRLIQAVENAKRRPGEKTYWNSCAKKFHRKARERLGIAQASTKHELIDHLEQTFRHFSIESEWTVHLKMRSQVNSRPETQPLELFYYNVLNNKIFQLTQPHYVSQYSCNNLYAQLQSIPPTELTPLKLAELQTWITRALVEAAIDQFVSLPSHIVNQSDTYLGPILRTLCSFMSSLWSKIFSNEIMLPAFCCPLKFQIPFSFLERPFSVSEPGAVKKILDITNAAFFETPFPKFNETNGLSG